MEKTFLEIFPDCKLHIVVYYIQPSHRLFSFYCNFGSSISRAIYRFGPMALPLCAFLHCVSPLLLFCFPIRLSPLLLFSFLNPESLPLMLFPSCSLGFHHCLVLQDLCSCYFTLEVSLPLLQLLAGLGSSVCKNAFHLQVRAVYAQSSLEGIVFYFKTLFGSNKIS